MQINILDESPGKMSTLCWRLWNYYTFHCSVTAKLTRLTFRQPEQKSSSESSERLLSVKCTQSGLCTLIGQFCRDVIGCKTQVAQVSRDWSVWIRQLGRSVWFVCNVNVVNESFVWCRQWLTPVEGSLFQVSKSAFQDHC